MSSSLPALRERVERKLDLLLASNSGEHPHDQTISRTEITAPISSTLIKAMRYACIGGGKRIRAQLVYGGGQCTGAKLEVLDFPAAAIEMMHAYSLVHDDLPAMDDDELRRGLPTCHIQFDEATAILAGDALQAQAMNTVLGKSASSVLTPTQQLLIGRALSVAAGYEGMVAGQMLDLEAENDTGEDKPASLLQLQSIHKAKTGALIKASVQMGALCSSELVNSDALAALGIYGEKIGLAFQVIDDILDIESDTETLGKPVGSDEGLNKLTYPALLGVEASKQHAQDLHDEAIESLSTFSDNSLLVEIATKVIERTH
ncbi:MAG TPA: geranyl transferase [Gammaproteobacteria bacterium]|jgi:farnesyl diphosphate synthase|nr:geranyl transferase [Pseudomonadota bacterium]HAY46464.1 geranyl transferase [Gammaproteobacteria bacterium]